MVTDHTSILRFIERRFKMPAMTARDANADPLLDLFDFNKAQLATPPFLPAPMVDQAKLADCEARYPFKMINFFPDMAGEPTDLGATD